MREIKYQVFVPDDVIQIEQGVISGTKKFKAALYDVRVISLNPSGTLDWADIIVNLPYPEKSFRYTVRSCDGVELRQFTGLKDKNGVEIYEGDILQAIEYQYTSDWPEYKAVLKNEAAVRYSVVFEDGSFCLINDQRNEKYYAYHSHIWGNEYHHYEYHDGPSAEARFNHHDFAKHDFIEYKHFEAIGNVYENPELLEATK